MVSLYEADVVAWVDEQAALLRLGQLSLIDVEHIARAIEEVGKSEQRALASRLSSLLAQLLKWQFQPRRRSPAWRRAIEERRNALALHLRRAPSLQVMLSEPDWLAAIWSDAVVEVLRRARLDCLPSNCPWTFEQILSERYWPE